MCGITVLQLLKGQSTDYSIPINLRSLYVCLEIVLCTLVITGDLSLWPIIPLLLFVKICISSIILLVSNRQLIHETI